MLVLSALIVAGFLLVGIAMLVCPRWFWYITQGWWAYDNPRDIRLSEIYRIWNGSQAVSAILAGSVLLVLSLLGIAG